ncbi:MAG: phage portal protein [Rickettsiales bacterium]|nr:phage portal protein [Rickettsiales bacterium]|tara:strand:+ start:191 stop:1705 length:1515 start_codon:yes stop_codon:yes gene_type:complete
MISLFGTKKEKQPRRSQNMPRRRDFAAAKIDRLTAGWAGVSTSADAAARNTLTRIRARSRQLAADNDYARRFFKLCRSNVVGSQGINLQVRAIERETSQGVQFDDRANGMIESAWYDWAKKKNCTIDGRLSWIDVKQLIVETVAKDGEIFVRKIRGRAAGNAFGFALQLLEADHIDETHHDVLPNGNKIRMGIEYNEWNRPVAYHVMNRHPGDSYYVSDQRTQRERILATDMIHLYNSERVSQSRGIPWMVSAMRRMNMLGGYEEAELVAARIGASKMGFFTSQEGTEYTGSGEDENGNIITEAEPGLFEQLPGGMSFTAFDPQHPTSSFGTFIKSMLRGAASGLGVSYNSLGNDLEGVNFSSIRQGALEERELWKLLQTWLIEHLCEDVFEDWLLMALTTQRIPLPLNKFEKFNKPIWRPRGWRWVDPLKEMKAYTEAVSAGFLSAQDVASDLGMDIEEVYAQLALEQRLRDKHGVVLGAPDARGMQAVIDAEAQDGQGNAES